MTITAMAWHKDPDDIESRLMNQLLDFSAAYMAVKSIAARAEKSTGSITDQTVQSLIFLLQIGRAHV